MYLINITIQTDKVPADQAESLLNGHRSWFKQEAEEGNFLLLGPYKGQMAGLVIAQADNRAALEEILKKDSYYPDLATYKVREFQANIISENITDYIGK